ncbi:hypothetical protein P154DRAFT_518300 [Amniculicola lignicola CBS 123094]|uniref:Uncharacterized protein n=1 Tax=Amniculicola lignicola CBS 123094 TaxID=1392246 RepID=A0A6A5WUQ0_9PLEO|nr:hypothetical protein P154DRAFT_518300 [Amniculicola lignicola CBS 123094]
MNNYSSFLDTSSTSQMPRQAPSPSPSQPQSNGISSHSSAGVGTMQAAANSIPMVNGLASGGQQTDMNYLWSVVQQLSQVLEENRAQTQGIVRGVETLRERGVEDGVLPSLPQVNGEINASTNPQLTHAQAELSVAKTSIAQLTGLLTDYENALTLLLDKLRPYAYTQTSTTISLHKHYQALLETERATNLQLRLEHAEWQTGLGRVAEYARTALKMQNEGELGLKRECKALREENRVLRRMAGLAAREDDGSDDEEHVERGLA